MNFVGFLYLLLSAFLLVWALSIQPQQSNPNVDRRFLVAVTVFLVVASLTVFRLSL